MELEKLNQYKTQFQMHIRNSEFANLIALSSELDHYIRSSFDDGFKPDMTMSEALHELLGVYQSAIRVCEKEKARVYDRLSVLQNKRQCAGQYLDVADVQRRYG